MIGPTRLVSLLALTLLTLAEGTTPEPQVVEMDTAGFRFTPREVEVTRGRPVRFVVTAKESPHAFSIPDLELEEVVLPGEPKVVEVTFENEGTISFRCRFHHRQGMVGTIRVEAPGSEASPSSSGPASRRPGDGHPAGGAGGGSTAPGSPQAGGS